MTNPETKLQRRIMLAASKLATVFRNNVGRAFQGKPTRIDETTYRLDHARYIDYGLCRGSSDVVGWQRYKIRPEDVGHDVAVFVAIEVKTPGSYPTKKQRQFLDNVRHDGGIAIVGYDPDVVFGELATWKASVSDE